MDAIWRTHTHTHPHCSVSKVHCSSHFFPCFLYNTLCSLPCPVLFCLTEGVPRGDICGKHIWVTHVCALIGGRCVGGRFFFPHACCMRACPCRQQQSRWGYVHASYSTSSQSCLAPHRSIPSTPLGCPFSSVPLTPRLVFLLLTVAWPSPRRRELGELPASWGGAGCWSVFGEFQQPFTHLELFQGPGCVCGAETMAVCVL